MSMSTAMRMLTTKYDGPNNPMGDNAVILQSMLIVGGTFLVVAAVAAEIFGKSIALWASISAGTMGVTMIVGGATGYLGLPAVAIIAYIAIFIMKEFPDFNRQSPSVPKSKFPILADDLWHPLPPSEMPQRVV